jgi:hypothetical protein
MQPRANANLRISLRCAAFLYVIAGIFPVASHAQQIPATQAKTLDGTAVSFPDAATGKPLLFVIGFSHKGGEQCREWNKQLAPVYLKDAHVLYYEAAVLAGVPSLVMKIILHGMRKDIPGDEQSRFVLLESNDQAWKTVVDYSAPDDAYLIVANHSGHVAWQTHGAVNDAQVAALQSAVAKLLSTGHSYDEALRPLVAKGGANRQNDGSGWKY